MVVRGKRVPPCLCTVKNSSQGVLSGKLYVLGGYNEVGNSTDTVELYNPATNTWTFARSLIELIITRPPWQEENSTVSAPEEGRRLFTIRTATPGLPELPAILCTASLRRLL